MLKEYNIEYVWESLNDFWRLFEDAPTMEQLWRGYAFTVNNLYYQLYQLDLSKSIFTIPYEWISDWERFDMNEDTIPNDIVTTYAGYPYVYRLPYGVKDVTMLRESPREVTYLPKYTVLRVDGKLVTPDGLAREGDNIYMPETIIKMDSGDLVFPEGVAIETRKFYPNIDYIVDRTFGVVAFAEPPFPVLWSNLAIRDLEIIYDNFGSLLLYYKPDSYKYLREVQGLWYAYWNGAAISNIEIGLNIVKDMPFALERGYVTDIKYVTNTMTIGNFSFQITTEQAGSLAVGDVIEYVNGLEQIIRVNGRYYRILSGNVGLLSIGDVIDKIELNSSSVTIGTDVYPIDQDQILNVSEGEFVEQFTPLTKSIGVFDYINYPEWWKEYTGALEETSFSCMFDGNPFFDTSYFDIGHFDDTYSEECLQAIFLQYFTFLVKIDYLAWFRNREEFEVAKAFLHAIKPAYTHYLFEVAFTLQDDTVAFDFGIQFDWNYVPTDIPLDFHTFDDEYIHPTFDDGAYFDFDCERDCLHISIWGSPQLFADTAVDGYIFDDEAVTIFDTGSTFDNDPYHDTMEFEMTRRIPSELSFTEDLSPFDSPIKDSYISIDDQ